MATKPIRSIICALLAIVVVCFTVPLSACSSDTRTRFSRAPCTTQMYVAGKCEHINRGERPRD